MTPISFPLLPLGARLLCAALALVTTSAPATAAVLLASWHHASELLWLEASPEVIAEVAACDSERERIERVRCKRGIVAARALNGQQPYPVATR